MTNISFLLENGDFQLMNHYSEKIRHVAGLPHFSKM